MTTNDYFDQEMRVMTPDKVMQPRAFALCWDTADEAERRRRGQKLQHLATDALGTGGFGVAPEAFKAAWMACRQAYREDPAAFLEQYLETGSWFSSAALMAQKLPELHYVVEGFLAQGLALLASPPKYGKSWLAMQLCLAVSEGQPFLGMPTRQATCLYLALEDGRQRLQKRLGRLGSHGSRSLYFETNAPTLAGGLLVYLESFLARHPDCRLVVVDTLQKVRGDGDRASSVYAADYADVGALKAFADRFGLCLLLVHHLRKMSDDTDPFNRIAGSNGIFGAADAAMVLARSKRSDPRTTLSLTGRDVEEQELILTFDKARCRWQVLGDACEVEALDEQAAYDADPLVVTIRHKLDEGGGRWQTGGMGIVEACRQLCGEGPATGQEAASLLKELAPRLKERDGIAWHCRTTGTSGRRLHLFARMKAAPCPNRTISTK